MKEKLRVIPEPPTPGKHVHIQIGLLQAGSLKAAKYKYVTTSESVEI